ncbi:MAG: sugar phosphate isomerase/epimerase [Phycisphaerales bacterium]|nr:sugar phosphate isomerase/epimerase [Phycisphaerales bacterium]
MKTPDISRRVFLAGSVASASLVNRSKPAAAEQSETPRNPICAFTKYLHSLSYDQLAESIAHLGFDGIEAAVREKGHILPERVQDDLPKLIDVLGKNGLEITIMTTSISRADQPADEKILRLAAGLGVKRYRMGYYTYDLGRPIKPQLHALRSIVREVAAMNREIGIQGLYQNHAGARYVGATVWDFQSLIEDVPVAEIGFAFDIRHAVVEAGLSWPVLQNVAEPHLGAVYVKDFRWENDRTVHVPLGEGRVDRGFLNRCQRAAFGGPFSLHVEYRQQEGAEPNLEALGQDRMTLRRWLAEA